MKMTNRNKPYFKALSSVLAFVMITTPMAPVMALDISKVTFTPEHDGVTADVRSYGADSNYYYINQNGGNAIYKWGNVFELEIGEVLDVNNGNWFSLIADVNGSKASSILGQINASGSLMIANKAGVIFGNDSTVNVGGQFQAVAGTVSDEDFFKKWTQGSSFDVTDIGGKIENSGTIIARGDMVLLGQTVVNNGGLTAENLAIGATINGTSAQVTPFTDVNGGSISFDMSALSETIGITLSVDNNVYQTGDLYLGSAGKVSAEALLAGDDLVVKANGLTVTEAVKAGSIDVNAGEGEISIGTNTKATTGDLVLVAGDTITVNGAVEANQKAEQDITITTADEKQITLKGGVSAHDHVYIKGGSVKAEQAIRAGDQNKFSNPGDVTIIATTGDVDANGIRANWGDIRINSKGDVKLDGNIGNTSGNNTAMDLAVWAGKSATIQSEGKISTQNDTGSYQQIWATENVKLDGAQVDTGIIKADNLVDVNATGEAKFNGTVTGGDVLVTAGSIAAEGQTIAATTGNINLTTTSDIAAGQLTAANGGVLVTAGGKIALGAEDAAADAVAVSAKNDVALSATDDLTVNADIQTTDGSILATGNNVTLNDLIAEKGTITGAADKELTLNGNNGWTGKDYGKDDETKHDDGVVNAGGNVNFSGKTLTLPRAYTFWGPVTLSADTVNVKGTLTVYDQWYHNSYGWYSYPNGRLTINANNNLNATADIRAQRLVSLNAGNSMSLQNVTSWSDSIKLKGGDITANGAVTALNGNLDVTTVKAYNEDGSVKKHGDVTFMDDVTARAITVDSANDIKVANDGKEVLVKATQGDLSLTAAGTITYTNEKLEAKQANVKVLGENVNAGTTLAKNDITIEARKALKADGTTTAGGFATVKSSGSATINKKVSANEVVMDAIKDLTITTKDNTDDSGSVTAKHSVSLIAGGAVSYTGVAVTAGQSVNASAGTSITADSTTANEGDLTMTAGTFISAGTTEATAGTVQATANGGDATFTGNVAGEVVILTATGTLNTQETVTANAGDVTMKGGAVNAQQLIKSTTGDVYVTAKGADTADGTAALQVAGVETVAAKDITLTAEQGSVKATGKITASSEDTDKRGNVTILAQNNVTTTSTSGIRANQGDIKITAQTGNISLEGSADQSSDKSVYAGNSAEITAGGTVNVQNKIHTLHGDVTVVAEGSADVAIQVEDVTANAGDIALTATNGGVTIAEGKTVEAKEGDVTIKAKKDIVNVADTTTGTIKANTAGDGVVKIESTEGNVSTGNIEAGQKIDIAANGGVFIDGVLETTEKTAGEGSVSIKTTNGNIYDTYTGNNDVEVKTGDLILKADNGYIGNGKDGVDGPLEVQVVTLDATAKSGINIAESDALIVKNAINTGTGDVTITSGDDMKVAQNANVVTEEGNITLTVTTGKMELEGIDPANPTEAANAPAAIMTKNGDVKLETQNGSIATGANIYASNDVTLSATNGDIFGVAGSVTAGNDVTMTSTDGTTYGIALFGTQVVADNNVDMNGVGSQIYVTQGSSVTAKNGDVTMDSDTRYVGIEGSSVEAVQGNVKLTATEDASVFVMDKSTVKAGTDVVLKARGEKNGKKGGVGIDSSAVSAGQDVKVFGNAGIGIASSTMDADRHIVLKQFGEEGGITMNESIATAQQNVRVDTQGVVELDSSTVEAANGYVTMKLQGDLKMDQSLDAPGYSTIAAKQDAVVHANKVTMKDGSTVKTSNGNALLQATAGDMVLGQVVVEAAGARATVLAAGDITRATPETGNGDYTNVAADEIVIKAGGSMGRQAEEGVAEYIYVDGKALQANAGENAYLNSQSKLTVKDLGEKGYTIAGGSGATIEGSSTSPSAGTDNAILANGDLRLNVEELADEVTTALVIDGKVETVEGNMRVETTTGAIEQNDEVVAGTDATLKAATDYMQNADITTGKDANLEAGNNYVMADDTRTTVKDGNLSLTGANDVYIETIKVSGTTEDKGNAIVTATAGSIIDIDHDKVTFNSKGEATNLMDGDQATQQETDITMNNGNLVLNAGKNIGEAGQQLGATDGLDVNLVNADAVVAANAGGDAAITAPQGNLTIGEVEAFEVNNPTFTTKAADAPDVTTGLKQEQNAIVAGGTANLAAEDCILDGNGDKIDVDSEKIVLTAGFAAGGSKETGVNALEVEVGSSKANAIWGNSTTESDGSVLMNLKDATGNKELYEDAGAAKDSSVVIVSDGKYHGGDMRFWNGMTAIHAENQRDLLTLYRQEFNVFNGVDMIYPDIDVADDAGAKYRNMMRDGDSVTITKENDEGEQTEEKPFEGSYNPTAFEDQAAND